jgi:hypothetical protein
MIDRSFFTTRGSPTMSLRVGGARLGAFHTSTRASLPRRPGWYFSRSSTKTSRARFSAVGGTRSKGAMSFK